MICNLAAAVILMAGAASAEMKLGRQAGRGGNASSQNAATLGTTSSVHAVPAAPSRQAAVPKSFASQQVQRQNYGSSLRRTDDGGQAPAGPAPQVGALIRTAGAGSKLEPDNSHRWHSVEAGAPQPGGLALETHKGVWRDQPDKLPGQTGSSAGTDPFGNSGVKSHQSWLEGIGGNNSGPNINVNNGNTNGNGNGNGNGRGN